jgi:hypothetical protein
MKSREKYHKLDEIGIVGIQGKSSASSRSYHKKKTGEAIRRLKAANNRSTEKIANPTR